jgi:hypothetical protein
MEGGLFVSDLLLNQDGHLAEKTLEALKSGLLDNDELILVSEHISECEKCAGYFANSFNDKDLAEAPLGFEEEIQSKVKRKKESDIQLVFYSLRVTIAACMALVFVFSNTLNFTKDTKMSSIKPLNLSIVNSINADLNSFSQKLINLEVFNNEKEKK